MPKKTTKENLNEMLWKMYQEDMKFKNNTYTVGTFGVWCYHKGLVEGLTKDDKLKDANLGEQDG